MKKHIKDWLINPRIELIPSILNIPLIAIILIVINIDSDFYPIINAEAAKIFGVELDYVLVLEVFAYSMTIMVLFNIIVISIQREKVPLIIYIIPIISIIAFSIIFIEVLNGNDFFTINYIFQVLGRDISAFIYIGISVLLIIVSAY